jgi:hypothetical protein
VGQDQIIISLLHKNPFSLSVYPVILFNYPFKPTGEQ